VLVDGLPVPGLPCPSRAIVRGDALSLSIAAASVIAKVARDRTMAVLDRRHPGYGFAVNRAMGPPPISPPSAASAPAPSTGIRSGRSPNAIPPSPTRGRPNCPG
jgi:ribonuclease HII